MATRNEPRLGYVPHFDVTTVGGRHVRYKEIWQRRNLVLAVVGPQERESASRYASQLQARQNTFNAANTEVVVTGDAIPGLPAPTILVADRWGEILHLASPSSGGGFEFPPVDELLSWVQFAEIQCPECPP